MPDFINTEHCVEKLFPVGTTFSFEGKKYQVALCGKPRPARGECKTDVYIKGIASDGEAREIKISVKQKNADFLENKMSFDRACEIFGKDASGIIKQCLLSIQKIYSLLSSLSAEEKMKHKMVHEMRVKNVRGEYIRIIEQEQAIELDKSGNIWLMLSVIDVDASHESEITKSHLYNFETGEQIFIDLSDTLEEPLTNRELSVLQLMKQGLLSKEIANSLNVSINTINTHRQNILLKLKANNSIEAVNIAQRLGLLNSSIQ